MKTNISKIVRDGLKSINSKYLIIYNIGAAFISYHMDAKILLYLTKIERQKQKKSVICKFHQNELETVEELLQNAEISYIIVDVRNDFRFLKFWNFEKSDELLLSNSKFVKKLENIYEKFENSAIDFDQNYRTAQKIEKMIIKNLLNKDFVKFKYELKILMKKYNFQNLVQEVVLEEENNI